MRLISIALASCAVAACASSPTGLIKPENRAAVVVRVPYQLALGRIVEFSRECAHPPFSPFAHVLNEIEHDPDLRRARITNGISGIGTQVYQVIEIREVDAESAEIALYAVLNRERLLARFQHWANGDTSCSAE